MEINNAARATFRFQSNIGMLLLLLLQLLLSFPLLKNAMTRTSTTILFSMFRTTQMIVTIFSLRLCHAGLTQPTLVATPQARGEGKVSTFEH